MCVFDEATVSVLVFSFLGGEVATAGCTEPLARLSFKLELWLNQSISESGRNTFALDFPARLARPKEEERGGMALGEAKGEVDEGGGVGGAAADSRDMVVGSPPGRDGDQVTS